MICNRRSEINKHLLAGRITSKELEQGVVDSWLAKLSNEDRLRLSLSN